MNPGADMIVARVRNTLQAIFWYNYTNSARKMRITISTAVRPLKEKLPKQRRFYLRRGLVGVNLI